MRPRTFYQSAQDVVSYLQTGNRNRQEIARHLGFTLRKVEYIITLLRRKEMILTILTRPPSYELVKGKPAISAKDGRPEAELNLRRGIGSTQPYYRLYRQKHKQG